MFNDRVFETISQYKEEHKSDVIRFEMALRAEIARIKQYRRRAVTEKSRKHIIAVENAVIENLNNVLALIPVYLNSKFNEKLHKTNFWERRTLKANCLNWKYHFYATERAAAGEELSKLLSEKANITIIHVKESAD